VSSYRPQARRDGLLIRSLADELVVYDLKSFRAACLNRSAAAVWQRCDGKHSVEMIAQDVTDQLGEPFGADAVWWSRRHQTRRARHAPGASGCGH
jgi:hypothetical protein